MNIRHWQTRALSLSLALLFVLLGASALCGRAPQRASAREVYYSDTVYTDADYNGGGLQEDNEIVYRDNYTVDDDYRVVAPSYGNGDASIKNFCAVTAGLNIVVYYDRFYPNLIPNFNPGMTVSSGAYAYFPDMGFDQTDEVFYTLYDEMQTNVGVTGTSGENFKDGLQSYVEGQGYDLSYSSFYSSRTNVNMTQFENAIDAGKVGVLLLTKYNFIYAITHNEERTYISRSISDNPHIMMVYGYIVIRYYNNGSLFKTETYLQASSGFSSGHQGYIRMDDYMQIEEALIVNIS